MEYEKQLLEITRQSLRKVKLVYASMQSAAKFARDSARQIFIWGRKSDAIILKQATPIRLRCESQPGIGIHNEAIGVSYIPLIGTSTREFPTAGHFEEINRVAIVT